MSTTPHSETDLSKPTWAVAHLFPNQGEWTENDFLALHTNKMVELVDSTLEVLPLPTWLHQLIVKFLIRQIEIATRQSGMALAAPLPVRLFAGTFREPDVMYFAPGSEPKDPRCYPNRVDLAMEVVGEGLDSRRRDYEDTRRDYQRSSIAKYWIVDPEDRKITVLFLENSLDRMRGEFGPGQSASGILIPDLVVAVDEVFNLGRNQPGIKSTDDLHVNEG